MLIDCSMMIGQVKRCKVEALQSSVLEQPSGQMWSMTLCGDSGVPTWLAIHCRYTTSTHVIPRDGNQSPARSGGSIAPVCLVPEVHAMACLSAANHDASDYTKARERALIGTNISLLHLWLRSQLFLYFARRHCCGTHRFS